MNKKTNEPEDNSPEMPVAPPPTPEPEPEEQDINPESQWALGWH